MAVEYDGGVIIGADSRTTTGYVDCCNHCFCRVILKYAGTMAPILLVVGRAKAG